MKIDGKWKKIIAIGCFVCCFILQEISFPTHISATESGEEGQEEAGREQTGQVQPEQGGAKETVDGGGGTAFAIDSKNIYEGMTASYAKGYVPKVSGNKAIVVLPLLSKKEIKNKRMTASLQLPESQTQPFVCKNYEKSVSFGYYQTGYNKTTRKEKKTGCYLVFFYLNLKKKRYNGSYPLTISVSAEDAAGNEINQSFTLYVTIKDGKKAGADENDNKKEETASLFAPKVIIDSYRFSKKKVFCGRRFRAKLTLRNTSKKEQVKNMLVSVAPAENVELVSKTNSVFKESLGCGKTCEISFDFRIHSAAPSGQYNIDVTMDYFDSTGKPYTLQSAVKVSALQKAQIEIAPLYVPKQISVGDTVELQPQAVNLGKGKLYNVRAALEAEGLSSSGYAFIGDMEPGTSTTGSMEIVAEGLAGDSLYGKTQGRVVFYYEDDMGNEMTQEQNFDTSLLSPVSREDREKSEDDTGQWWIIMGIMAAFFIQAVLIFFRKRLKKENMGEGAGNEA